MFKEGNAKNYAEKIAILLFIIVTTLVSCQSIETSNHHNVKELTDNELVMNKAYTNKISRRRMLLILNAPSIHDEYYADNLESIVEFQINYAKAIIGNDNVVVIVDKDTLPYYQKKLPEDILITHEIYDIWMRDFTTINPFNPVQFDYTSASMSSQESRQVQNSFQSFALRYEIERIKTDLVLDGGNIVDNYRGRVITTTRFMEDNDLTYQEAKQELIDLLEAKQVAIIEPDDEVLAHSDGMVSWIDDDVLLVNDYSDEPKFRSLVLDELKTAFPDVTIIEVPVEYKSDRYDQLKNISSACGVNLNATVTFNNIYVPIFNMPHEQEVVKIIKKNTSKNVITINAENVCSMGGSVRCLTWQLTGENAQKLITAARNN